MNRSKPRWRYRCARTGRFLSKKAFDRRSKKTTIRERVRQPKAIHLQEIRR